MVWKRSHPAENRPKRKAAYMRKTARRAPPWYCLGPGHRAEHSRDRYSPPGQFRPRSRWRPQGGEGWDDQVCYWPVANLLGNPHPRQSRHHRAVRPQHRCLSALVQGESMPDVMREEKCAKIGEARPEVSDTQCCLLLCLVRHSRVISGEDKSDKSVDPQFFFHPGPSNLGMTPKWLNRHPEAEKERARFSHGT